MHLSKLIVSRNTISLKEELSTVLPEEQKNKWRLLIVSFMKGLNFFSDVHFDFAITFLWLELASSGDH